MRLAHDLTACCLSYAKVVRIWLMAKFSVNILYAPPAPPREATHPHHFAKRPIPHCKTAHFTSQNGPFRSAKWAVLHYTDYQSVTAHSIYLYSRVYLSVQQSVFICTAERIYLYNILSFSVQRTAFIHTAHNFYSLYSRYLRRCFLNLATSLAQHAFIS